jgi:hypothetical protein
MRRVDESCASVPVPATADGPSHRRQDHEHSSDDQKNDADRPQNADIEQESQDKQDQAEHDRADSMPAVRCDETTDVRTQSLMRC